MNKLNYRNQKLTITVTAIIFLTLTILVVSHYSPLQTIDNYIQAAIRSTMSPSQTSFLIPITNLMGIRLSLMIAGFIIIVLFLLKQKSAALFIIINCLVLSYPINGLLKLIINRPRPALHHLVFVHSSSYPSGHAMISIMLGGSLILLMNHFGRRNSFTFITKLLIILFIMVIGYSRIYLGVHYPSDVIAGYCMGLIIINTTYILFKRWHIL
ncbi:phosphatase PAP2 family protein [Lentilactobacillus kosonis]|uniref:Membrane-associated phospholipid phosphatase n=1 Tax=Lentilactobacillus kosonis TaxID=2810561 RepID=A0A401FKF6_9LACO|nr:phosphatase PAP2 family protein [Lentilactobacillus kosonis]GAY72758.1 membrane-associated phospholipid phosphatase [Lentilactobacillus kosonis]